MRDRGRLLGLVSAVRDLLDCDLASANPAHGPDDLCHYSADRATDNRCEYLYHHPITRLGGGAFFPLGPTILVPLKEKPQEGLDVKGLRRRQLPEPLLKTLDGSLHVSSSSSHTSGKVCYRLHARLVFVGEYGKDPVLPLAKPGESRTENPYRYFQAVCRSTARQ